MGRKKDKIPMLVLKYPGDDHLIKIQRRQFVRIETALDIAIHPLEYEFDPIITITDDISAGGAAILVPKEIQLKNGILVQTWFVLNLQSGDYQYMKLQSRIVRTVSYNETRNKVSLQFIDVSGRERQMLLRFCFERQLDMKKKGFVH